MSGPLLRAWVVIGAGLLAALRAWDLWARPDSDRAPSASQRLPTVAGALVVAWALLQLAPLSIGVLEIFAPATAELCRRLDVTTGVAHSWPISLEPLATLRLGTLGAAYVVVFCVAETVGSKPRVSARVALAVALVGGLVSLYAVACMAELPLEDPWQQRPREPFVNPNHLATFLIPCLALGLGVLLAPAAQSQRTLSQLERALSRRALAGVAVLLMIVGVFLSQSRGGLVAASVAIAATVLGAVGLRPARSEGRRRAAYRYRRQLLGLGLAVGALASGVLVADRSQASERFDALNEYRPDAGLSMGGRIQLWKVAARVVAARPLGGSGLGTFDAVSRGELDPQGEGFLSTRPESAHNDYLELCADLGLPAAALGVGAVAWLLVVMLRRLRGASAVERALGAGCVGGTLGVLAHAVVEFGLQIPGAALVFAVTLGLGWGLTAPAPEGTRRLPRAARLASRGGIALVLIALGGLLAFDASREREGERLFERFEGTDPRSELRVALAAKASDALERASGPRGSAASCLRHASASLQTATPDYEAALRLARAASVRAPALGRTHAFCAYLLLDPAWSSARRVGRDEDELEALTREGEARLKLALELDPTEPSVLLLAARLELDLFSTRGDPEALERALAILEGVLARQPSARRRVQELISSREARLGASAAQLRHALGVDAD